MGLAVDAAGPSASVALIECTGTKRFVGSEDLRLSRRSEVRLHKRFLRVDSRNRSWKLLPQH